MSVSRRKFLQLILWCSSLCAVQNNYSAHFVNELNTSKVFCSFSISVITRTYLIFYVTFNFNAHKSAHSLRRNKTTERAQSVVMLCKGAHRVRHSSQERKRASRQVAVCPHRLSLSVLEAAFGPACRAQHPGARANGGAGFWKLLPRVV